LEDLRGFVDDLGGAIQQDDHKKNVKFHSERPEGFNPMALAKSYGMRDLCNIDYYRRAMERKVNRFVHPR
jgi:hypothetical protein